MYDMQTYSDRVNFYVSGIPYLTILALDEIKVHESNCVASKILVDLYLHLGAGIRIT